MKILFVKSSKIGSTIIRWGLGEPVSHVIVEFQTSPRRLFHSYGSGIQQISDNGFEEHGYEVVKEIELHLAPLQEDVAAQQFKVNSTYQGYDWRGFAYFGWRAMLKKFFGRPIPSKNPWGLPDFDLCTEVIYLVVEIYAKMTATMLLPLVDLGMTSPWQAYLAIKKRMGELGL